MVYSWPRVMFLLLVSLSILSGPALPGETDVDSSKVDINPASTAFLDEENPREERLLEAGRILEDSDPIEGGLFFNILSEMAEDSSSLSQFLSARSLATYWRIRAEEAPTIEARISILLEALNGAQKPLIPKAQSWAALELCRIGAGFDWGEIQEVPRAGWGAGMVLQCKRQIELVELCDGDLDRAMALALSVEDNLPGNPIHQWAKNGPWRSESREAGKLLIETLSRQLPESWWSLHLLVQELRTRGWSDTEMEEAGWTNRPL